MPRPKRTEPNESRLELRLSPKEKSAIQAKAKSLGYGSVSEFIRAMVDQGNVPRRTVCPVNDVPKVDAALLYELNKIGVNLNQIAYQLNSGEEAELPVVNAVLRQLDHTLEVLLTRV
jgi:hypothetical protein